MQPSTRLVWDAVDDPNLAGYRVHWRDTTSPVWENSRFVGDVTDFVFEGLVIDNFLFGVSAVGRDGNESTVVFPNERIPRGR